MLGERLDESTVIVHPSERGALKQALLKVGWPAEDLAGYVDGEAHPISLLEDEWQLRPYQTEAIDGFRHGGSGVGVLQVGRAAWRGRGGAQVSRGRRRYR